MPFFSHSKSTQSDRPIPAEPAYIVAVFPDGSVMWEQATEEELSDSDPRPALKSSQTRITYRYQSHAKTEAEAPDPAQESVMQWFAAGVAIAALGLGLGAIVPAFRAASHPSSSITVCPTPPSLHLQRYSVRPTSDPLQ